MSTQGSRQINLPPRAACLSADDGRSRHGFTLLEMMVVLAIVGAMVAFSWPSLRRQLEDSRLRDAAKQLRLELVRTRFRAMESGTVLALRYEPLSGRYETLARQELWLLQSETSLEPSMSGAGAGGYDSGTEDFSSGSLSGAAAADDPSVEPEITDAEQSAEPFGEKYELPSDIKFSDQPPLDSEMLAGSGQLDGNAINQAEIDFMEPLDAASPDDAANDEEDSFAQQEGIEGVIETTWSEAVLFYPDGTATNARFRIVGAKQSHIDITVRGLTGAATISDIIRKAATMSDMNRETELP